MDQETRKTAMEQYLKYFMGWFIMVAVVFVVFLFVIFKQQFKETENYTRKNNAAPEERVYDFANIFTDSEEAQLSEEISRLEDKLGIDIVIVSIDQAMEGSEAASQYGYRYTDWTRNMRDTADDFYDQNNFGYNKIHGDGVLFLTNDMPGQKGTHLSTCGKAMNKLGSSKIDSILTKIDDGYEDGKTDYKAHMMGLKELEKKLGGGDQKDMGTTIYLIAIVAPVIIALIYLFANYKTKEGKNTVNMNTYVDPNGVHVLDSSDMFMNKTVTKRKIESSSGGGGGHVSRGGVSHGGGSHRR